MPQAAGRRFRPWLLAPWALLLGWVGWLAADVVEARKLEDPAWIASRVDAVDVGREDRRVPVTLRPAAPGQARVWAFGSSGIASPHPTAFITPLERHLGARGRPAVVDNLGVDGFCSWDIAARIEDAWAAADAEGVRPDAIVLYAEHNDVTYTFHYALDLPHFDAVMGLAWVLSGEALFGPRDAGHTYWHYGHRRAPAILKVLQQAGLLSLDPAHFQPLRDRTARAFEHHIGRFLDAARGVPVIVVPAVGRYEGEPYGPLSTATALWAQGRATDDPDERLRLLLAARDAETFTSDLRAKTELHDALRRLAGREGVTACDVEGRLHAAGHRFDDALFTDPVHFSERGYELATGVMAACLVEGPLGAAAPVAEGQ